MYSSCENSKISIFSSCSIDFKNIQKEKRDLKNLPSYFLKLSKEEREKFDIIQLASQKLEEKIEFFNSQLLSLLQLFVMRQNLICLLFETRHFPFFFVQNMISLFYLDQIIDSFSTELENFYQNIEKKFNEKLEPNSNLYNIL